MTTYSAHWELLQVLSEKKTLVFNYVFDYDSSSLGLGLEGGFVTNETGTRRVFPLAWEESDFLFSSSDGNSTLLGPRAEPMVRTMVKIWTSFASYRRGIFPFSLFLTQITLPASGK
jgi:hypothetical protein